MAVLLSVKMIDFVYSVFKTVFDSCDGDRVGRIHINQLSGMLSKLGKSEGIPIR